MSTSATRFGEAITVQARVVFALVLREMRIRFGRTQFGCLWAVAEPLAFIAAFSSIFYFMDRHPPFGIRAVLSEDDGRTWQTDCVQVLRTDGDNYDLGYPRSVQLKDGTIVTIYYYVTADYITHIACTRWRAPQK